MIVRESGTKTLSCDDCGETLDQSFPDGQFNTSAPVTTQPDWRDRGMKTEDGYNG